MAAYVEPQVDARIEICANASVETYAPGVVAYTVINGTGTVLSNINAAGTDVPRSTCVEGVSLTQSELATLLATRGAMVTRTTIDRAQRASILERVLYAKPR